MRLSKLTAITVLLFAVLSTGSLSAEAPVGPIEKGEVLTLQRCMEIALANQPAISAAAGSLRAAESRVGQAEAGYYPQIELSSGYKKSHSGSGASILAPTDSNSYSAAVSLKQNIYDFGKRSLQVSVTRHNLGSFASDLENARIQAVFNVKQAYYGLLQSKKNLEAADEALRRFEKHLEQAKGFYEAGARPKFDVTRAEVDLSNARVSLIKAENSVRLGRAALNRAMGVPVAPEYSIKDNLAYEKYDISLDTALSKAFASRPDLKAAVYKRMSAGAGIELSRKNYYPALNGNASYGWQGDELPPDNEWNIAVTFTAPLFTGWLSGHQVEESRANYMAAGANEELMRQNVILDVTEAHLGLKEAEARISSTALAEKQAEENLGLANGRYEEGVGNPIEITDAASAYINAKAAHIQALTDYKTAEASLEKAMGER
ncbi:MAG: TolC family protein [Deltaproteobacteria bacterium]|nr:TolC family protein [Deltaproteobacteria bacterium]